MAATKTYSTYASGTLTAGTPVTSSVVTANTQDFIGVLCFITNGATGPTLPGILTVLGSYDNTNFFNLSVQTAGTTASTTYYLPYTVTDAAVSYVKITLSGNTAQNCTYGYSIGSGTL